MRSMATAATLARGCHGPRRSIEDQIRMKRAAGRPKDLIEVEVLAAVRDEIEGVR
jgi:hypothetical protein